MEPNKKHKHVSEISYKSVEQGIKILDLEAVLTTEKNNSENLRHKAKESDDLRKQLFIVERENERQRFDLLNAQQSVQLAESGLEKALREISIWKDRYTEADKARKRLDSLNPEKLKRNLAE